MNVKDAYKLWSEQYDTNDNKTRDLEAISMRTTLAPYQFDTCLEIGCGTGKNTEWLITKANQITAIDLSEEMLAIAKEKVRSGKVSFHQADITGDWNFVNNQYDLIIFSLVLEHIEHLGAIIQKTAAAAAPNGLVYIGELHPFKQYMGTKARFETAEGLQTVTCFNHNISDFTSATKQHGFEVLDLNEFFDGDDRTGVPRILTLLLRKS